MNNLINSLSSTSTVDLLNKKNQVGQSGTATSDFSQHLKSALNEVNELQVEGDEAVAGIATGQVKDLHQAALSINKAEINMKLMLEIRNKALNAYKELGRTQI